eukprot:5552362-Prymnesium_polylepis.2
MEQDKDARVGFGSAACETRSLMRHSDMVCGCPSKTRPVRDARVGAAGDGARDAPTPSPAPLITNPPTACHMEDLRPLACPPATARSIGDGDEILRAHIRLYPTGVSSRTHHVATPVASPEGHRAPHRAPSRSRRAEARRTGLQASEKRPGLVARRRRRCRPFSRPRCASQRSPRMRSPCHRSCWPISQ